MALPVKDKRYTAQEYLELERQAEYKSEFIDGEIFPLTGANQNPLSHLCKLHNRIRITA